MSSLPSAAAPRPGILSRLVGGYAPPPRELDLLSPDQPPKPDPPLRRWRYNAGVRGAMMALLTIVAALGVGLVFGATQAWLQGTVQPQLAAAWANTLAIPAFLAAYLALTLWWEQRRPPYELAPRRATGLLYGLAWGVVLQLACVGVLALAGAYRVHGFDWSYWIVPALLSTGFGAAINEEIMFRGVLYRLLEDTIGTWGAIAVSGLSFGLAHLTNANATLQGALAIAVEAGVLFAALYALTRSLWLVMGLHFAWNMMQGPVLGIVVSGTSGRGVGYVRSSLTGPDWLAGGGFGMEASAVTVAILTAVAVWVLIEVRAHGLLVAPYWVRRRRLAGRSQSPPTESATES